MDNSMQSRLERTRRHRSWANAQQPGGDSSTPGGGDKGSRNSVGSPGNVIMQIEERTRLQTLQNQAVRPSLFTSQYGLKSSTSDSKAKDEGQSTPFSPPTINTVSSHDSNHTANSVASRRQRIMAMSANNKAPRRSFNNPSSVSSPRATDTEDVSNVDTGNKNNESAVGRIKPRSWRSPQSKTAPGLVQPEPIETLHNYGGRVAGVAYRSPKASSSPRASSPSIEMENHESKGQPISFESPRSKNGISNRINAFQSGISSSSNDRASPPPPPPPSLSDPNISSSEQVNKFKRWNERDQNDNGGRVVAYPSHTNWKGKLDSPSSGQQQNKGNRFAVPRSPTASIGSVDSSFSGHQPNERSAPSRNSWNSNSRVNVSGKVLGSPEIPRTFASPKYGASQARYSAGSRKSIESRRNMYNNLPKPSQKETEAKESYGGAIIETPEKSSVSSLHAMFDSKKNMPLMPMNSTHSSVRTSLGSPVTPSSVKSGGMPTSRSRSFTGGRIASSQETVGVSNDDRSVSSVRSASSANRPRQPVVSSWSQKQQQSSGPQTPQSDKSRVRQYYDASWRMQSPVNNETTKSKASTDIKESYSQDTEYLRPSNLLSSWQQRCKPRPLDTGAPDPSVSSTYVSRKSVEANAPSASVTSFMYSQNKNSEEENQNTLRASMDWPTGDTQAMEDETATDVILDSLTDVNPNDIGLAPMVERALSKTNSTLSSGSVKPWENDTKHSVVQSWQMRSSKPKDSASSSASLTGTTDHLAKNETEDAPAANRGVAPKYRMVGNTNGKLTTNGKKFQPEIVPTKSSSDSFIEEKKSDDLSFDENEILGEDIDGGESAGKAISAESSQHGDPSSHHPRKMPFYDDDSYLSRGDTDTRGLAASESLLTTTSGPSRTISAISTYNSEDMSLYVEDERTISKKESTLSAEFEQMNLEVDAEEPEVDVEVVVEEKQEVKGKKEADGTKEVEEKKEETTAPALTINVGSTSRTSLPRINPSPKDCDEYRSKYFEDSGSAAAKLTRGNRRGRSQEDASSKNSVPIAAKNSIDSLQSTKSTENQLFDIWASTSKEERDEAISFDQTDQWLDADPDVDESAVADEGSSSSEQENNDINRVKETPHPDPEARPILIIKKPRQSFRTPEVQKQRSKAMNRSSGTKMNIDEAKQQQVPPKQDVFDPFGIDAEETGGLTVEISEDLFSSNPDPFMTEESFSPLEWSTPGDANTNTSKNNAHSQHIGYYNSPDSRVEI